MKTGGWTIWYGPPPKDWPENVNGRVTEEIKKGRIVEYTSLVDSFRDNNTRLVDSDESGGTTPCTGTIPSVKTMTTRKPLRPCASIPLGRDPGILPLNPDLPLVPKKAESRQGPASSVYIFNGSGFEVAKPNGNNRATAYGHELYSGPAVEVEVYQDDAAMELEVKIKQTRCLSDCTVRFGPVKAQLSDLFDSGHWLEVTFYRPDITLFGSERQSRVYLTDGTDRYKVYSIDWKGLQSNGNKFGQYDLGVGFHDRVNLLRTHSSARYPKPVIQEKIVEKIVERDPFDVLAERYPRGKKRPYTWDTVVGNRTLRERLFDHV